MTLGTGVRKIVRSVILQFKSTATHYKYSEATIVTSDEGDEAISWGTGTSISVIPSSLLLDKKIIAKQFEENIGDLNLTCDDQVTFAIKDKIIFQSVNYKITDVKKIWLQDVLEVTSLVLSKTD